MGEEQVERVREPAVPEFDKAYWENHWTPAPDRTPDRTPDRPAARATSQTPDRPPSHRLPVNPYLPAETRQLPVGTALDAGCGTGTEALWLAQHGWQVTGADISTAALATATARARTAGLTREPRWLETDLTRWEPGRSWDLVVSCYAHPSIGQLGFYQRIASWVAPGGSLLIVGHLDTPNQGHHHPQAATATRAGITGLFAGPDWQVDASYENSRTVDVDARTIQLHDVVVRAHRRLSSGQ